MEHPGFFQKVGPFRIAEICEKLKIEEIVSQNKDQDTLLNDVASLASSNEGHLSFFEDKKLIETFQSSKASACFVKPQFKDQIPSTMVGLITNKPHETFVEAISLFYPTASFQGATQNTNGALIDPSAVIEEGAIVEAGAVIGKEAHIGADTIICSGAVIGYRTYIGRNCKIGPNAVVTHSLIGNEVTIHSSAAIGQDGFGYIMGSGGHKKVPQIGRVIIQDKVEIGANTSIDRGALTDTIIGEGTKIDNLVQIAHNVVIGCHAVIVSQTGISGSCKIGNYVVMGGQTGAVGHIEIGDGAQIAASSNVHKSVPAKARYGGTPAKPMKQWFKEIIAVEKMVENRDKKLKK